MVYRLLPLATCGGGSTGYTTEMQDAAAGHLRRRQLAAGPRQVVRHHPTAPDILRGDPVPRREFQSDQRRAHFFARQQTEVSQLLPGTHAQPVAVIAIELRRPLPRPAQGDDGALAAAVHVEVAKVAVGWPAACGGDLFAFVWPEHGLQRLIVGRRIRAT